MACYVVVMYCTLVDICPFSSDSYRGYRRPKSEDDSNDFDCFRLLIGLLSQAIFISLVFGDPS